MANRPTGWGGFPAPRLPSSPLRSPPRRGLGFSARATVQPQADHVPHGHDMATRASPPPTTTRPPARSSAVSMPLQGDHTRLANSVRHDVGYGGW